MTTERGAPAFWARGGRLTAQGSLGPGSVGEGGSQAQRAACPPPMLLAALELASETSIRVACPACAASTADWSVSFQLS